MLRIASTLAGVTANVALKLGTAAAVAVIVNAGGGPLLQAVRTVSQALAR